VDAVVLDHDGQPVAGLGPEDFELRDEGEVRARGTSPASMSSARKLRISRG
jgi:hypothetical protein